MSRDSAVGRRASFAPLGLGNFRGTSRSLPQGARGYTGEHRVDFSGGSWVLAQIRRPSTSNGSSPYNGCSAMASPTQTVPPQTPFKGRARRLWLRLSDGMALHQLWSQFEKDARSSYRLYSAGLDEVRAEPSRLRRVWGMAKALFWAILEKLTPARRVLLVVALVMLFFPGGGATYSDGDKHIEVQGLDLHFWGGLLMFVVLL